MFYTGLGDVQMRLGMVRYLRLRPPTVADVVGLERSVVVQVHDVVAFVNMCVVAFPPLSANGAAVDKTDSCNLDLFGQVCEPNGLRSIRHRSCAMIIGPKSAVFNAVCKADGYATGQRQAVQEFSTLHVWPDEIVAAHNIVAGIPPRGLARELC